MPRTRRHFVQSLLLASGGLLLSVSHYAPDRGSASDSQWFMPEEGEPHAGTWMSFIASHHIWSARQIPEVRQNLALIAIMIAKYEPVFMLVRPQDHALAVELLGGLTNHNYPIELIEFQMNDLWMRDTAPIFVLDAQGNKAAIDFNFNGWGESQAYDLDAKIASFVAQQTQTRKIRSSLTLEGGCFEVDGQGTAIMTESCILNQNRNPNRSKVAVEAELKQLLGLEKIIWLKGIKGKDITDGHTDFYARFAKPGVVVVSRDNDPSSYDYQITRENIRVLQTATDAKGNDLELVILDTPYEINTKFGIRDFAAGYVGYYVCNGAVIMQKFGDTQTDRAARSKLAQVFPERAIEQIQIDGIASGGGSIHCATQQEPRV